jgi:ABC-type antimicrobial peptide transport system permease subunit
MLLGVKNLWQRSTRTLLTLLGIVVGVAAVVVLGAFGEGMARGFGAITASAEADLLVSQKDSPLIIMGAIDSDVGAAIAQLPGVDEVAGVVASIVQVPDTPYFLVMGEDPHRFSVGHYRLIAGQPLRAKRQILLGKRSANSFRKAVGDSFRIGERSYRVVGIYETGAGFEDSGAVIHLADTQRAFDKRHQVSYFKVKLRDLDQRDAVKRAIEERWDDLAVARSGDPMKQDEVLGLYRSLGWILGIFAVLVGGLGMMNAMLMSVFERTREIGVLRALGWRRRRVIALVLGEALALALIGALLGVGLGIGLIQLASRAPAVGGFLSGVAYPAIVAQALLTALGLGALGGIYPAWRAARLAPVEAMRAEGGSALRWGGGTRRAVRLLGGSVLRNIWRRPIRTLLTISGLGIGVGFIVALLAIVEGARLTMTQLLTAGQADLVAEEANVSDAAFSTIDERIADQLRSSSEVRAVSRLVFGTTSAPGLPFFIVYGLDPGEEYIQHYQIREGRALQQRREIMLGRLAAESLEKELGDALHIAGTGFTVVGIYENGQPYEDAGGVIALKEAQRLFGKPRQVSFIGIRLAHPEHAAAIAAALERAYPEIMVSQAAALTERMQDFATMNAIFGALVALMLVVGGIVMMNVMLMSVFERTQEIGVLRALGWRRRRVLRMVLLEAVALSLLGGLLGILIGLGLNALLLLEPSYGRLLPPAYSATLFAQALAQALALGALGGLLPAWRAASLRPIEALRYE